MLILVLMVGAICAAAPENTGTPADHVSIAGISAPLSGGTTNEALIGLGDSGAKDPLRRHLSTLLAQNGGSGAERSPAPDADAAAADGGGKPNPTRKWQTVLPILGEEAEAKGHTLPLAFGLMPGFYHGRRHISVSDSQVTIKRMSIPADRLTDIKVKSRELNWSMRLDAWLFPFFNIYGLIGYTREDAYAGVAVTPLNRLRTLLGKRLSGVTATPA